MEVFHLDLGISDFGDVWELQEHINKIKQDNPINDIILTTQHNNVYTLGRSGDRDHLLVSQEELKREKIAYYEIDRGGDLTYHGHGQLVCYPIFDLKHYYLDAHRYLRDLEEAVIMTLKEFNISSGRDNEFTGVWVGGDKICAIGIKLSRWITMHGLALNINNDLGYFGKIIPCGIFHKGITSMKKILNSEVDLDLVESRLLNNFKLLFNIDIEDISYVKMNELFFTGYF
jgi:lipoyl(octanoyl) transferase